MWVPTAGERDTYDAAELERSFLNQAGAKNLILLHTRSRDQADSEEFAAPLKRARGVWFAGGRQWRLVDATSARGPSASFGASWSGAA